MRGTSVTVVIVAQLVVEVLVAEDIMVVLLAVLVMAVLVIVELLIEVAFPQEPWSSGSMDGQAAYDVSVVAPISHPVIILVTFGVWQTAVEFSPKHVTRASGAVVIEAHEGVPNSVVTVAVTSHPVI